ncbi:hypothetical protein ACSTS3_22570 [Aquimarina muelleri]|uniref:hypothetical protein n=1 Tax=Aquimarina muelleri TaxID=279356 RepID=UPI003F682E0B
MSNTCTYTGSKNNIPDNNLGSYKEITCRVEVVENKIKRIENATNTNWHIGTNNDSNAAIKDYNISSNSGIVTKLSSRDLGQNPVSFKLWKNISDKVNIRCSGNSSEGKVVSNGTFSVKKPIAGTLNLSEFLTPAIHENSGFFYDTFSRGPVDYFNFQLSSNCNGQLGMMYLIKSKIIETDPKGKQVQLINTNNEFVLYNNGNSVFHNKTDIINGVINMYGDVSNGEPDYEFRLDSLQHINKGCSYHFDEEYKCYLMFKSSDSKGIWHPIGLNNSTNQPFFTKHAYSGDISYNKETELWTYHNYVELPSTQEVIKKLPTWDKNIQECLIKQKLVLDRKPQSSPNIVTKENVENLILICNLAEDAPEWRLPLIDKIAFVNSFVTSTYGNNTQFKNGSKFANVRGSAKDPKVSSKSWKTLWEIKIKGGNSCDKCTSFKFPPKKCPTTNGKVETSDCQTDYENIIGGHVVRGTKPKKLLVGKECYILPICQRHNMKYNIHMKTTRYYRAVYLKNFMT